MTWTSDASAAGTTSEIYSSVDVDPDINVSAADGDQRGFELLSRLRRAVAALRGRK